MKWKRHAESIALGITVGGLTAEIWLLTEILYYKQVLCVEPNPIILICEILGLIYALAYNVKEAVKR